MVKIFDPVRERERGFVTCKFHPCVVREKVSGFVRRVYVAKNLEIGGGEGKLGVDSHTF